MRTIHYVFILLVGAALFFVNYDLSRRMDLARVAKNVDLAKDKTIAAQTKEDSLASAPMAPPADVSNSTYTAEIFAHKFKEEAAQIAKVQNNPLLAQKRMRDLAELMTPQDVQGLYEIISDDKNDGDQRALAVELLSIKNDTTSLIALQNFVANNTTINGTKWDRKKELETVLRAQAVESIAAYPQKDIARSTLNYLQQRVDEKFLIDRIKRAAQSLNGGATGLQQQDEAALKNLIE